MMSSVYCLGAMTQPPFMTAKSYGIRDSTNHFFVRDTNEEKNWGEELVFYAVRLYHGKAASTVNGCHMERKTNVSMQRSEPSLHW